MAQQDPWLILPVPSTTSILSESRTNLGRNNSDFIGFAVVCIAWCRVLSEKRSLASHQVPGLPLRVKPWAEPPSDIMWKVFLRIIFAVLTEKLTSQQIMPPVPNNTSYWSDTLSDILWKVMERLQISDYIRCSAVCSSWREVLSENRPLTFQQIPWLMLPDNNGSNFFSISENKKYRIDLSGTICGDQKIIGSSEGWLISVDLLNTCEVVPELHMFDPLSGTHLLLPSITTLPHFIGLVTNKNGKIEDYLMATGMTDSPVFYSAKRISNLIFSKMVVSPSSHGTLMVAGFCYKDKLAFARVGDESWKSVKIGDMNLNRFRISDIIFYREQQYVVKRSGIVLVCDLSTDVSHRPRVILMLPPPIPPFNHKKELLSLRYLVESSDGNLWQVLRHMKHFPESRVERTVSVRVFVLKNWTATTEVNGENYNEYWTELETIGDDALFLGNNHSVAFPTRDFPELRKNCIYFTDNRHLAWDIHWNYFASVCDIGVYSMEDRTFDPYFPHEYQLHHPPVWFTPRNVAAPTHQ